MRIVIAGAHGRIARELGRLMAADGHDVAGLIRNPDQATDLEADGVAPVVLDLENSTLEDVVQVLTGADAAVFAAGAGPGSGAARKDTVDRAAAVLLADAAEQAGAGRFLQVSSGGLDAVRGGARPESMDEVMYAYLVAKLAAEEDLMARSQLDWTIVRPGILTNDAPIGLVELAPEVDRESIPRQDVAAVLAELLKTGNGVHQALGLVSGTTPVPDAVQALQPAR
ncbi:MULTISPECIES: NAD(P)-binding oxidoreductase [unclassified Arthrobacter]|uniref:NAD(P)-binding oxidoreductase n=1 Tax=unclassified Arthrobacter TaxID=235627 RepID=UPI0021066BD7|nr:MULTISPECIES: NAD(P)-binding oxidoreductase [unclassified Arthrobacter]MCQ1947990.1 SDR family oxidoreductase [Arthrobacter sp. zg-Y1116]MCQ1987929.1 SDR family oxidoreductase [Arthrobacter sp. zg-Y844]MCQ1996104.1 SDR family oxidoreductase [Arthrobacter sp. zg-Y1171]UWX82830.1 SDR family oxidoreductase [Arthrobacter sp. zg-Y1171]